LPTLETLRKIVQAVNNAASLDEALATIVARVKQAMSVDVCSVYLTDADGANTLMQTDGLNAESVGRVRMEAGEGLVGLVTERQEPVNLMHASEHPRFRYFPETGEETFDAFLGVPIIHYRRPLGVLIVQQVDKRSFSEDECALLVTVAAQLAGTIAYALEAPRPINDPAAPPGQSTFRNGVPGAPGIGMGTIVLLHPLADLDNVSDRPVEDAEGEVARFRTQVEEVQNALRREAERMAQVLTSEAQMLFDVHILLLGDESLTGDVEHRIRAGNWAPGALRDTIREHVRVFSELDDPYMRARAEDVRDIGRRLLLSLQSREVETREYPKHSILMADEISIAHISEVPLDRIAGIVSLKGSRASHIAVLADNLGVPAVMGLGDMPLGRLDGKSIVVDGYNGQICIDPSVSVRSRYKRLAKEERSISRELHELQGLPAETTDGARVRLYVNSGLLNDATEAAASDAEGVGLFRTEYNFLTHKSFPSEEEQYQIYRQALEAFAPRHVVMRTLDIGGDKPLPYFPIQEENPFLGWRGIRLTLDHPEIYLTQLRALLRANEGLNNLYLLLPMVTWLREVDAALELLDRAQAELEDEGHHLAAPPLGVMIEVPAMVYQADALLRRADFLSIGTNDLTQYLLAVDRNNARVAPLYDSLHPSVLHVLVELVETAHRYRKPISVCGEMAGDPAALVLLLAMGVDILSMSPASIDRARGIIRRFSLAKAKDLLNAALRMEDAIEVRSELNRSIEEVGLGALVRAGK
jgi:phosphotransferase system enzyme I (PtsP)